MNWFWLLLTSEDSLVPNTWPKTNTHDVFNFTHVHPCKPWLFHAHFSTHHLSSLILFPKLKNFSIFVFCISFQNILPLQNSVIFHISIQSYRVQMTCWIPELSHHFLFLSPSKISSHSRWLLASSLRHILYSQPTPYGSRRALCERGKIPSVIQKRRKWMRRCYPICTWFLHLYLFLLEKERQGQMNTKWHLFF